MTDLAATKPGTVVGMRDTFAFQLPVTVIREPYGLADEQARKQLAVDTQLLVKSSTPPAEHLRRRPSAGREPRATHASTPHPTLRRGPFTRPRPGST
ncbi:hypothetical protein [Streptomyces sp. NPDC058579]|uniref:hypothetical protein n=1 Tax=Streptomyces sp. NPDC058579 TaxID=3346548 RepID=UPI00365C70E6